MQQRLCHLPCTSTYSLLLQQTAYKDVTGIENDAFQDLFKCFVGTAKENTYTNAIWNLLHTNNHTARSLPGASNTSVSISYPEYTLL